MRKRLHLPSGRVIALGRLLLATLFFLAIWVDASQPAQAPAATYALLAAYMLFAAAMVAATWRNWLLDARLAGPAHAVDILLFTLLVLLTAGYTSPFFTFFVFVLLSAAIRWGWRATALTAVLLTLLYLTAGLVVETFGNRFELQRFMVRTGHLVILSLILIWFGANQWRTRFHLRDDDLLAFPALDESPVELRLRAAMAMVHASAGLFLWREQSGSDSVAIAIRGGEAAKIAAPRPALAHALAPTPFLYDIGRNQALKRDEHRNLVEFAALDVIDAKAGAALGLGEGLAIPIRSENGEGQLFLERVPGLSADHIDLGEQIAADIAAHFQRHALVIAAGQSAEARSRLTLARDLHDSVVQFLAGAAFRLEAMKRSIASGRDLEPELNELKQLMMQEQGELRAFIAALRSGPLVAFNELSRDLRELAGRLSRQWDVQCEFSALPAEMMVPTRLHLDTLQLTREAVANAARHANAKSVSIKLAALPDRLQLEFVNDGADFPVRGKRIDRPQSLTERVEQAGGTFDMARGMGVTRLSITLPIGGRHR